MLFRDSVKFCNVCRIYNFGAIQRPRNEHFHYKDLRHSVWQHLDSLEKPQHEIDSLTFKLDAQKVCSAHAHWAVQCGSNAEDVQAKWSNLLASCTTEQLPLRRCIQISLIRSTLLKWRVRVYDCTAASYQGGDQYIMASLLVSCDVCYHYL